MSDPGRVNDLVDHLFRREAGRIASRLTRVFGAHRLDLVDASLNPPMMRSKVVLPHPLGPSSEKNSPRRIESDTPSSASGPPPS